MLVIIWKKNINPGNIRITEILERIVLNAAYKNLIPEGIDYENLKNKEVANEMDDFEMEFLETVEHIEEKDNDYIHHPEAVSRPVDVFHYKYWERIGP